MLEYYCYIVFIFSCLLIDLSKSYKILTLEDPSLCSPIVKRRIKLGAESQSGLIVTLSRLKDHTLDWEKNFFCKFQIDAPKDNKIFAVVQNLAFRRNENTNECIDYIHLKRSDGSISKKYCGNVTALPEMDSRYASVDVKKMGLPANAFDDFTGQLDVNIHIAKEALSSTEYMDLSIVFTSYRPCSKPQYEDQECSSRYNQNCIYKGFINDAYLNCPYFDCVDEGGCYVKITNDDHKKSVGSKVIISTVTLLVVLFAIFIFFIYLCRKYQKFCWSEQFSSANNIRSERPSTTIELDQQPIPQRITATVVPTVSAEEDKDLPPSYETLFPNR